MYANRAERAIEFPVLVAGAAGREGEVGWLVVVAMVVAEVVAVAVLEF